MERVAGGGLVNAVYVSFCREVVHAACADGRYGGAWSLRSSQAPPKLDTRCSGGGVTHLTLEPT